MREIPGTLRAGGIPFPTTHWSVVVASGDDSEAGPGAARTALTQLCHDYWPPIYSFVRRHGHNAHDAQDLTQGFFAYLLEGNIQLRADPTRGKFRSFLLGTLKHFLSGVRERDGRIKRGGEQEFVFLDDELDAVEAICAADPSNGLQLDAERHFEWDWAEALVSRAMTTLRAECADEAKTKIFRELEPFLRGGDGLPSQEDVGVRLGLSVTTLRSHLSRLRARYRHILRAEIARTVVDTEDVDGELRYLCGVLIAGG